MVANMARDANSYSFGINLGKKYVTTEKIQTGMSNVFISVLEMRLARYIAVKTMAAPKEIAKGIDETLACKYSKNS